MVNVRRFAARASAGVLAVLALTGCPPHHVAPPKLPPADIAAISDLHLGDPRSLLEDEDGRAVLLDLLADACERRGVRTLVIDGDVLELALASEASAFGAARDLFRDLNRVPGLERVVVIIGNHDHRLFEEIAEPLSEKLNHEFDEGTHFHREIAEVNTHLRVTVVYPGWSVAVPAGFVHFTHGHYFDRVITPKFDGTKSVAEIEEANQEWWSILNAGGVNTRVRELYRAAYHFGHHVKGLVDSIEGNTATGEEDPEDMSEREQTRVEEYVGDMVRDPEIVAVVAGHTHNKGGRVEPVFVHGREVEMFDPGAFVVGHHKKKPRPFLFLLDSKTGDMRLEKIPFPEALVEKAEGRAFETVP